uniref:phosphoglycerate mutase (2,3-diphosphoglycerate-independent) n=1 Tax=Candidatus Methanogaster sp. ANME-2c ERB4 TaxID=2759911 RepID=A0A7G9YP40_9EURY|nr:2,3-bisphosphoglycerate-independent phosphoglycerate mutase [Methanosarcinales archaeon ANME-2c ERB4]QNO50126.1 2,3-bisphosphoglycerate-independent phosphoglycerate mutase [Methanosarcinales archaeon ANME-2c ERB4]
MRVMARTKYIILLGDGMADVPLPELGGKTPLEHADTSNMDYIAKHGRCGLARTVPPGMPAGSDIANMSVLGYAPEKYYTGRGPLEAASMGVTLAEGEIAFRCNLITVADGVIADYSAGHITSEEASVLIESINDSIPEGCICFHAGISYRHLMVTDGVGASAVCMPPHDVLGEPMESHMPVDEECDLLSDLIRGSARVFRGHWVNEARIRAGKNPATHIWLWGQGGAPSFPSFKEMFGITGSMISAVDLLKGLAIYAGMDVIEVPGATGYLDTNYAGKADYAVKALEDHDFVYVHVEAPDEAGHAGDVYAKVQAIEDFDEKVVGRVLDRCSDCVIMVLPDHPTPIPLRTHTADPVPFAICGKGRGADSVSAFDEKSVAEGSYGLRVGAELIRLMIR